MAQVGLREFDVKKMFFESIGKKYNGIQIKNFSDLEKLEENKKYVLKPDMLFGKRSKRGLLWINKSKSEIEELLKIYLGKSENIDSVIGNLEVFLVEELEKFTKEYYLSFALERDGDRIFFSENGGIDIEENWEKTKNILIPLSEELTTEKLKDLKIPEFLHETFINLWNYYRNFGFVSLEFNPIAEGGNGNIYLLDAVGKVDDQELFLQKENWKDLQIPNTFGFRENDAEKYIRKLDSETGASLKMKILNENARIWTLFAGGGGSLVLTDSLGFLGFASDIGNYGELSGNPTREFTREYTKTLFGEILKSKNFPKYLVISGAIANFTDIAETFNGIVDVLKDLQEEIRKQKITILVRRGGRNEKKGLETLKKACEELGFENKIVGSDVYMTDILKEIKV